MKTTKYVRCIHKVLGKVYVGNMSYAEGHNALQDLLYDNPTYYTERDANRVNQRKIYFSALHRMRHLNRTKELKYGRLSDTICNHWVSHLNHSEDSWTQVYLVDAQTCEEAEAQVSNKLWGGLAGYRIQSAYDCTGQAFHCPAASTQVYEGRWLITQFGGLDI